MKRGYGPAHTQADYCGIFYAQHNLHTVFKVYVCMRVFVCEHMFVCVYMRGCVSGIFYDQCRIILTDLRTKDQRSWRFIYDVRLSGFQVSTRLFLPSFIGWCSGLV